MRTENARAIKPNTAVALFVCALFCFALASAQTPPNTTIKDFRAPLDYFPPPHELQMQSFLQGSEAQPLSDGLILIHDAKLQTFQDNGDPDMTVTAPQCVFDTKEQTVNSAGPFQMQTSDDKLLQQGVGFLWQKTNSVLTISNRSHTTIRGPLTNSFTP